MVGLSGRATSPQLSGSPDVRPRVLCGSHQQGNALGTPSIASALHHIALPKCTWWRIDLKFLYLLQIDPHPIPKPINDLLTSVHSRCCSPFRRREVDWIARWKVG